MNSTSMEEIVAEGSVAASKKKIIELPTAEEQEEIKRELEVMSEEDLRSLISTFNATYLKYMAKEIGEILSVKNYSGISKDDLKKAVLERLPLLEMLGTPLRDLKSIILSVFLLKKEKGTLSAAKPKAKSKVNAFINSIRAMNMPSNMKEMMIRQAMSTFAKDEKAAAKPKVMKAMPPVEETGMEGLAIPADKPVVARKTVKKVAVAVANNSLTEEEQRFYNVVAHLDDVPEDVKVAFAKVNRDKIKNPVIAKHDGAYIITSIRKAAELKVTPDNFIYPVYSNIPKINAKGFGVLKKSLGISTPPGGGTGSPVSSFTELSSPAPKKGILEGIVEEEENITVPSIVTKKRAMPPKKPGGPKGTEGGKRKTRRNRKHGSKTRKGRK